MIQDFMHGNFISMKKFRFGLERKKLLNVGTIVRNSVDAKTSYGGTSTKNIKKMILKLKREFL